MYFAIKSLLESFSSCIWILLNFTLQLSPDSFLRSNVSWLPWKLEERMHKLVWALIQARKVKIVSTQPSDNFGYLDKLRNAGISEQMCVKAKESGTNPVLLHSGMIYSAWKEWKHASVEKLLVSLLHSIYWISLFPLLVGVKARLGLAPSGNTHNPFNLHIFSSLSHTFDNLFLNQKQSVFVTTHYYELLTLRNLTWSRWPLQKHYRNILWANYNVS